MSSHSLPADDLDSNIDGAHEGKTSLFSKASQSFGANSKKFFHNQVMTFGDNLRTARKKARLTQEQVAERIGVSRAAVGQWEKNETMPEGGKIPVLADLLDVSPNALFGFRECTANEPTASYGVSHKAMLAAQLIDSFPDAEINELIQSLTEKKQRYDELLTELLKKRRA